MTIYFNDYAGEKPPEGVPVGMTAPISSLYEPTEVYQKQTAPQGVELSPAAVKFVEQFNNQMSGYAQVGNPDLKRKEEGKEVSVKPVSANFLRSLGFIQ